MFSCAGIALGTEINLRKHIIHNCQGFLIGWMINQKMTAYFLMKFYISFCMNNEVLKMQCVLGKFSLLSFA